MLRFQQVLVLTIVFISSSLLADTTNKKPSQDAITEAAGTIASQYHDMGWFSGNVLLAKDGKVFFTQSYGFANKDKDIKNSMNTRFNLGSIMKDFTKVLILQQITAGKLSADDKLEKFNLGFPQNIASKVTVQHLLDHSAGFRDIFTAEYRENQLAFDTLAKKLQLLIDESLLFEPGTDHRYSNYGYVVLGGILEKVTGQPFEQLLHNKIFEPVAMSASTFKTNLSLRQQSVFYSYQYNNSLKAVGVLEHPGPDGGITSTTTDVLKFYRELFYGKTLLDTTHPKVRSTFAMDGPHWGAYGGGIGVSAAVEVSLTDGIEIVVLANSDQLIAERISGRILSFIRSGEYEPVKQHVNNFTFQFYKKHGKNYFFENFKDAYDKSAYSQFIGRTINELGMQLLKNQNWPEAFDMFNYLVSIFPTAPQAYDSLSYAWLVKGDTTQAEKTFEKARELNRDFNSEYSSDNYGVRL